MKKSLSVMILLFCMVSLSLSACGRKGQPAQPEGADPEYPRTYPAPQPVPPLR